MIFLLGIITGLLICCLILLIEIRLLKTNSTITEKIVTQLERLKPRGKVEIIKAPTAESRAWEKIKKSKTDVKLDDIYEDYP